MKSLLTTVKRFLNAEEVPRWFGLTIVLIYLVGLGSVAYLGVSEARRDGSKWFQRQSCYAVELLADRLATLPATNPSGNGQANTERMAAYCHELQAFRARVPSRWVRIVDGTGSIVASSDPNDTLGADPDAPSVTTSVAPSSNRAQEGDRLIRVPIRTAGNVSKNPEAVPDGEGADQAPPDPLRSAPVADTSLILEARLPWQPYAEGSLADHAGTLVAVLAALGALFMTYRCLRQQMRGVSRIADRLASHHERLEEELDALRIGDVAGGVTDTWNRLIEMTQHFREAVQRTDANKELFNALQESGHGALADALNVIPDGIIYITDEVRFEFANAAARRLLGWEADRVRRVTLPDAESTGVGQLVLDRIRGALRPDGTYEDRTEVLQGDPGSGDGGSYRLRITPCNARHRAAPASWSSAT
ncbi:MAG: PAS domain-containing protein [Phycisphaerae bacterium]